MYESFYQLQTNPFSLSPDPHFCYSHTGHQQAREYLEYALKLGEGMVMVTGRPGTGKTTLVESFLANLNSGTVSAARIAVSRLDSKDLLRAVAYAYDIDAEGHDKATLRHLIRRYLETLTRQGRRALLIIDEAQGLPRTALDELRLLADLQAGSRQMLQLFLVGQEQLHEQMQDPEMDYFQQRVIANYHLVPLDLQETRSYIEYRLSQAGWRGTPEFTGAAVLDIHRFSKGLPRHINKLCNRLLLLGYGLGSHCLDSEQVQQIIEEMGEEQLSPVNVGQAVREADAVAQGEQVQLQDLLSELAIRMDESLDALQAESPDAGEARPQPVPETDIGIEESRETAHEPAPVAEPFHAAQTRQRWQALMTPSLVVVTVAFMTFVIITGIVDPGGDQRLAMLSPPPQPGHSAPSTGEQSLAMDNMTIKDPSLTSDEFQLLQKVLKDEMPATATAQLKPEVAAPAESPVTAARSLVPQATDAASLVEQGHQALMDDRLLKPALNSAYYYFQGALRLEPGNSDAARGIERIVERYVALTNKALENQDGLMASRYIARGLSIQPGNSALLSLKERSSIPVTGHVEHDNEQSAHRGVGRLMSRVRSFFIDAGAAQKDEQAGHQMTSSFLYE